MMEQDNTLRIEKAAWLLIPIMALAFYIAFIPNMDYPYPVHIDEWVHIAHSNALLEAGDIVYPGTFTGEGSGGIVATLEMGFHVLFGVFYRISGMSWVDIARYLPGIIFCFTALSAYVRSEEHTSELQSRLHLVCRL